MADEPEEKPDDAPVSGPFAPHLKHPPPRPSRIPHNASPGRPKRRRPKPLPKGLPDWLEPWSRGKGSGALVLAAGAWIAALVPLVPDRYDKYLYAFGGLCSVFAVAVQRVAQVRTNHYNHEEKEENQAD